MAAEAKPDQLVVEIDNGGKIEIWSLDNVHSKSDAGETFYKYHMVRWDDANTYAPYAYVLMLKDSIHTATYSSARPTRPDCLRVHE